MPKSNSFKKFETIMACLVVIDVFMRLLCIGDGQPPLWKDSFGYWVMGSMLGHGNLAMTGAELEFRTPGYPALIAILQLMFGTHAMVATAVVQHLLGIATSLITAWTCWRISGQKWIAPIAYVLSLLCISRSWWPNYVMSETFFTFTLTLTTALIVEWHRSPNLARALTTGMLLGVCILIRPSAQVLPLVLLATMPLRFEVERIRATLKNAVALLFGLLILVGPWIVRNYSVHGQIFLSKLLGRSLWLSCFDKSASNLPIPPSGTAASLVETLKRRDPTINWRHVWTAYRALRTEGLSELQIDDLMIVASLEGGIL